MDQLKHFSHNHTLAFHQVPPGSEIQCSCCKSPPASGNVYACWQCSYFLHEQCFRASRSFKHPSHPLHPLTLVPSPTYPSGSFLCNSCSLAGDGFSYTCSECEFDIHLHCALSNSPPNPNPHVLYPPSLPTPNLSPQNSNSHPQIPIYPLQNATIPHATTTPEPPTSITHFNHNHALKSSEIEQDAAKVCSACELQLSGSAYCCPEPNCRFNLHKACFDAPREIQHESHNQHPTLTLLPTPQGFTCNACCQEGKGFAYTCASCAYILHIDCTRWTETLTRPIHAHPLTLFYTVVDAMRDKTLMCGVCDEAVHPNAWRYACQDQCGFRCHTMCVYKQKKQKTDAELTPLEQLKILQDLDLQMQMVRFQSQMMANFGRSWL